ncbi:S1C family serine protease [Pedococcus dokdonensis]|uniref:S1C family serine protease n=1 Tax=Pedococcus dokdonensis TaxID=443156 RepID=UPI001E51157E|nr:trypsin-like peptidase domain-containing protein [Pedococcus dokdonensis]
MDRLGSPLVVDPPQGVADEESREPRSRRRADRLRGLTRSPRRWLVATLVVAVVLAVGVYALTRGPETPPITATDVNKAVQDGIAKAQQDEAKAPTDATTAYQAALPSIVTISTVRGGGQRGTGAGVVASAEGSVLTARHVVDGASSIEVAFSDGTKSPATVAEQDEDTDIAVLTPQRLPQVVVPAVLGGGAKVGDDVFALGHPLGLNGSLSAGVVSALDRTIRVDSSQTLKGLIQFDAAVNPGNSGGPLLDKAGQVVGIVTGLANPSEQNFFVGIGFAVPIATAGGVVGAPPQ